MCTDERVCYRFRTMNETPDFDLLIPSQTRHHFLPLHESPWFGVQLDDKPLDVAMRVGRDDAGRLVCTGLILGSVDGSQEITARDLRRVPLSYLLTALAKTAVANPGDPLAMAIGFHVDRARRYEGPRARPGPKGHSADHFQRVAEEYRHAYRATRAPIKELAKQMHASEPTVRRWVQRARDMGYLGPSASGKAGEFHGDTDDEGGTQ